MRSLSIIHSLVYPAVALTREILDRSVSLSRLKRGQHLSEAKRNILIIRLDSIGDFVLFSPSLKYYKSLYPNHKVTLFVNSVNLELAKRFINCVDELIPFESKKFGRDLLYRRRLLKKIRERDFNVIIDPAYSRSRAAACIVRCSSSNTKIGFDGDTCNISKKEKTKTDMYYTKLISSNPDTICEIERNREFIEALGIKTNDFMPVITPTESDEINANRLLFENGLKRGSPYVVLGLGAVAKYRMWPLEKYAEIIRFLKDKKKVAVVLCGSKTEKYIIKRIVNIANLSFVDLIGKTTLLELAAILKQSLFYLGNETGVLHLTVAVGTPTICILGGGHFGRFFPYGDLSKNYAIYKPMDCFGCNWRCKHSILNGQATPCILNISVDSVLNAVKKFL